jgi:hypothetical protein
MSDAGGRGPQVDPREDLYRAITTPDWWEADAVPPRPRSAAFRKRKFSVNVASEIGLEGAIRHLCSVLKCPDGGLVSFNCGFARQLGFDARREIDEDYRDNTAHANVYYDGSTNSLKSSAKRLASAEECQVVRSPRF